jgi:hypothetical protein
MRGVKQPIVGTGSTNGGDEIREVRDGLKELAAPLGRDEKRDDIINRAARRSGISFWRVFNIWYGKARCVDEPERRAVQAALDRKRREAARNELHELRTRILRLESLLAQSDPDFHREDLAALGEQRRRMG